MKAAAKERGPREGASQRGGPGRLRHYMVCGFRPEQAAALRQMAERRDCSQAFLIRRGVDLVLGEGAEER